MPIAEQPGGDPVLRHLRRAARPGADEEGAGGGADPGQEAGRPEVRVADRRPAAQHDQRDVDDGEDAEQQQRGGAAEQADRLRLRCSSTTK